MNKKHIRTIIILALVLLTAIITILNIDIEPAEQPTQSSVISSPVVETQKPKAEPDETEKENSATKQKTETEKESPVEEQKAENKKETPSKEQIEKNNIPENTKQSDDQTVMVDANLPEPTPSKPQEHFCTIEIRCDTVKDTSKLENQAVAPYVPKSGVILKTSKIEFTPGESVFDILLRATKERNIHMEYRSDNVYTGGKYIEGINYLYEMDAGPLSGWMYKVNGKFPNYGCAGFKVCDGDVIVWMYTCDLGADVGDNSTW